MKGENICGEDFFQNNFVYKIFQSWTFSKWVTDFSIMPIKIVYINYTKIQYNWKFGPFLLVNYVEQYISYIIIHSTIRYINLYEKNNTFIYGILELK